MNGTPVQPQGGSPAPKKSKALVWILGGCLVFIVVGGVAVSGFMWWTYHKAKNYVSRVVEENPALKKLNSDNMTAIPELWPDVPKMDGMTQSQHVDMPVALKIVARPVLDGMMRGLNNGADAGHWDWTAYSLNGKTPADVTAFYTPERMTAAGWQQQGGCQNLPAGLSGSQLTLCAFQKKQGDKTSGLLIVAANNEQDKAASLFFIRQEAQASATQPSQPAPASGGSPENAPVPYNVDKRPMPNGLALDVLLPSKVGPYTRTGLRQSGSNTVPTEAKVDDGNPIYADYRSGDTKIFVEFAVTSKPEYAQSAVQTVADENIGRGQFPTDPQKGRMGRDPSYLRWITSQGATFAWTRGGYYFTASAPSESALDAFVQAFPY